MDTSISRSLVKAFTPCLSAPLAARPAGQVRCPCTPITLESPGTASPGCNRLKPASTKASSSTLREMQDSNQSSTASRNDSMACCSVSAWVMTSMGGHQASHTAPFWRVHACSFTLNSTMERCTEGFLAVRGISDQPLLPSCVAGKYFSRKAGRRRFERHSPLLY